MWDDKLCEKAEFLQNSDSGSHSGRAHSSLWLDWQRLAEIQTKSCCQWPWIISWELSCEGPLFLGRFISAVSSLQGRDHFHLPRFVLGNPRVPFLITSKTEYLIFITFCSVGKINIRDMAKGRALKKFPIWLTVYSKKNRK